MPSSTRSSRRSSTPRRAGSSRCSRACSWTAAWRASSCRANRATRTNAWRPRGPHRRGDRAHGRSRHRARLGARALARRKTDRGHGAAPVRSRRRRLEEDRVPPGRRARLGQRPRRAQGRRRGRAPRLRDPHRERRHARDQRGRFAHRVRGRGGRPRAAPLLRVERRRLRLPRRQPGLAHRGRAATRHAASTSTRSRRRRSSRCWPRCCSAAAGAPGAYVFRPCVVAGPRAQMLLDEIPYVRLSDAMPDAVRRLLARDADAEAGDPGSRAPASSSCTRTTWRPRSSPACSAGAPPGAYNLAGAGTLRISDLARALGWYSIPSRSWPWRPPPR